MEDVLNFSIESIRSMYRECIDKRNYERADFIKQPCSCAGYDIEENPKDIKERVKTFEDACEVLCLDADDLEDKWNDAAITMPDELAYQKLRIIVAALNEGWSPEFTEDEERWYPWFYFYTEEEYKKFSEEKKSRCVGRSSSHSNGGLVYADVGGATPGSYSDYGSRLAFKNEALAIYAGNQFKELYADFYMS